MHLGQSHQQRELVLLDSELEESSAADDLETRENDATNIHVRDENISGDFSNMLKKTKIKVLVLEKYLN